METTKTLYVRAILPWWGDGDKTYTPWIIAHEIPELTSDEALFEAVREYLDTLDDPAGDFDMDDFYLRLIDKGYVGFQHDEPGIFIILEPQEGD